MRMISFSLTLLLLALSSAAAARTDMSAAQIIAVRDCYPTSQPGPPCGQGRDAIFFVHGIFGGVETFTNGSYRWPRELAAQFPEVDVFIIKYDTQLMSWLNSKVSTFDEIAEVLMAKMQGPISASGEVRELPLGLVNQRGYRSIGFIAHSLGGNVAAAYLHSVKSELGHVARSQNAFLITLGTPASGAYIANVAKVIKRYLSRTDPLLVSLERDNLFLRMLALWRRAEHAKANQFECREVNLFVGIEGAPVYGIQVVPQASAREPYEGMAKKIRVFETYNHLRIAAPKDKDDPLNEWVVNIIKEERRRMDDWGTQKVCKRET